MKLLYEFDASQNIINARFDGLDGCESVSSVKEALGLMQIVNPAVAFADAVKSGMYLDVSDEAYQRMLNNIKRISLLWHYPDDPADSQTRYQLNALMLLANAIEVISKQDTQIWALLGQA